MSKQLPLRGRVIIGIDPGYSGGIGILDANTGRVRDAQKMPVAPGDLAELLGPYQGVGDVWLEQVHSSPQMGVRSAFTFGQQFGICQGVLASLCFRVDVVTPQRWQTALGCMSGGDKNKTKVRAQGFWPGVKITHATADALLIAEYGRRSIKG